MDERKKKVLHAIIDDYITNAEPVGSRAVAKKSGLGVSPATIRNEMSDLEELGFIEQPYTSAGRVPSDKGYRYFVDHLMEKESLTRLEIEAVRHALSVQMAETDDFMRSCCSLIAKLTNYTTMVSTPHHGRGILQKLQLIAVNDYQVLVMMSSSTGLVRHKLINVNNPISPDLLSRIELLAAARLIGRELDDLNYQYIKQIIYEIEQHQRRRDDATELLKQVLLQPGEHKVYTGGALNMLIQPEFRDPERLKGIFELLEEDNRVKALLQTNADNKKTSLSISIGAELDDTDMQDCSLIVAHYYIDGEQAGSIGVLGPRRMSYPKTVSLMDYIAKEISKSLYKYYYLR
ncbi:MAG: heat-inducible transcriptional repressor HrcA [Clostridiales bacterium]|nr:heat-inducible transcriptional repressor HrcA [Clostridiales bacterium]